MINRVLQGQKLTHSLLSGMKRRPSDHCRIVFVSSQAGQVAIYGYSAYAPTKYALRGFAEAIRMELKSYNIWVTIGFPPNTRTEGFVEELRNMPEPTRLISGDDEGNVMDASKVSELLWKDVRHGRYQSTMGTDGWMLGILTAGMTPIQNGSFGDLLQQLFLTGLFRLVSLFYLNSFDGIVARCRREGTAGQKKIAEKLEE